MPSNADVLEKNFRKRVRIAAQNAEGKYSSTWIFWGNRADFYLGAKSLSGSIKVSLHANGRGYVAFDKAFMESQTQRGVNIPKRTVTEWKLPTVNQVGAAQFVVVKLPADFCTGDATPSILEKKVLVLGVEEGRAAEIGIFGSYELGASLEERLSRIGHPLFNVRLENNLAISIVVRSGPFDPKVLPSNEQFERSKRMEFSSLGEVRQRVNLNAVLWNDPSDEGVLQLVDIGGLKIKSRDAWLNG
jgi:hypothetical protein